MLKWVYMEKRVKCPKSLVMQNGNSDTVRDMCTSFTILRSYLQLNELFQRVCIVLATFKAVGFSSLIDRSSCLWIGWISWQLNWWLYLGSHVKNNVDPKLIEKQPQLTDIVEQVDQSNLSNPMTSAKYYTTDLRVFTQYWFTDYIMIY